MTTGEIKARLYDIREETEILEGKIAASIKELREAGYELEGIKEFYDKKTLVHKIHRISEVCEGEIERVYQLSTEMDELQRELKRRG